MKIPYPSINDKLATSSHMYICRNDIVDNYEFVKCQTLKPYMIYKNTMQHYWDEKPDINRNPFLHTTRIDCDKTFNTHFVHFDEAMKTKIRPDVSDEVFNKIEEELISDGYSQIDIPANDLKLLNYLIR